MKYFNLRKSSSDNQMLFKPILVMGVNVYKRFILNLSGRASNGKPFDFKNDRIPLHATVRIIFRKGLSQFPNELVVVIPSNQHWLR